MKSLKLINYFVFALFSINIYAANIDGSIVIGGGEYQWSTDSSEGSAKWMTHHHNYSNDTDGDDYEDGKNKEYDDGSTGDKWDINYLGTDIVGSKFQFGARGGAILSGSTEYNNFDYILSDFAISVGDYTDPTLDSSGFEYAVHLDRLDGETAYFQLFAGGTWEGVDLYSRISGAHETETFKMTGGKEIASFEGKWTNNVGDDNVLEGEFDLSLLKLFDLAAGGNIVTYLTMNCVNDEAMVHAEVSAVPVSGDVSTVPVPAAVWLFSSALLGLIGFNNKRTVI